MAFSPYFPFTTNLEPSELTSSPFAPSGAAKVLQLAPSFAETRRLTLPLAKSLRKTKSFDPSGLTRDSEISPCPGMVISLQVYSGAFSALANGANIADKESANMEINTITLTYNL